MSRPRLLRRQLSVCWLAALPLWASGSALAPAQGPKRPAVEPDHAAKMARGLEVFQRHVKPVLRQRCLRCHGGEQVKSELDLGDRAGLLKGGNKGPAVVPGRGRDSLLVQLISHARKPFMPKVGDALPPEVVAQFVRWIDLGAPYDEALVARKKKGPAWTQRRVSPEDRRHWSLAPLRRPTPPPGDRWCRTPIDRFILAKLNQAGLRPNAEADRATLVRRLSYDLIGLPPGPEEVQAFVEDRSPGAYERLVDRLLESPHYGERWARYWLDLARFAESHGFEHDYDRPSAYHYRDFVIKALNADLPYDTFVQWQLAGDELAPDNALALMATGFLAAGVHSTQITKNEVEKHRYDEMDDMLATAGTALLGLTIGCARCHDHKYDPIPQRDYYRLLATFTTTVRTEIELNLDPEGYKKAREAFDRAHAPLVAALGRFEREQGPARLAVWEASGKRLDPLPWVIPDPVQAVVLGTGAFAAQKSLKAPAGRRDAGQRQALVRWFVRTLDHEGRRLREQVEDHQRKAPRPVLTKVLISSEGLPAVRLHTQGADFFPETYFLRRGDPNSKQGVASQGFLQVLMPSDDAAGRWQKPPPAGWRTSYRRRALAGWMTDLDQGAGRMLARVIVNRLWQHHLGRGLVATPSDFGTRGERPSHPELLDWLASELVRQGWRLKPIHKLILMSAVYRQSASSVDAGLARDPDNKLLWRWTTRRLDAEVIRDSLLAVSGRLDRRLFGPGTLDDKSRRRSIYFTVKRSKLVPMMQVFDAPEALTGVAQRPTTTIAPQALLLMNNEQVRACARAFARRLGTPAEPLEELVRRGFLRALARSPSPDELADCVGFIRQQAPSYSGQQARELALADFCQVLLCLNDFVYVN